MPLDPQFRVALDTFEAKGLVPLVRGDAATTRAHYRRLALSRRGADYVPEQVASAALVGAGPPAPGSRPGPPRVLPAGLGCFCQAIGQLPQPGAFRVGRRTR